MDRLILDEKLESLRRCLRRIEEKKPRRVEVLVGDPDIQDILVLNLTRAVQICVDIGSHVISESDEAAPQTMGDVFTALQKLEVLSEETSQQMRKAVGFRNVAVHNYQAINWEIVFAICENSMGDFHRFARDVDQYASI